jgi:hypothetical protein
MLVHPKGAYWDREAEVAKHPEPFELWKKGKYAKFYEQDQRWLHGHC